MAGDGKHSVSYGRFSAMRDIQRSGGQAAAALSVTWQSVVRGHSELQARGPERGGWKRKERTG